MNFPDYPFVTKRRVEFSDTDAGGIMHFTAYFRYLEQAEHEMLRQLQLGVFIDVDGARLSWPRVATECNFLRPAKFEDELSIGIGVQRLGEKSVTYHGGFWRGAELLATGKVVVACCQIEEGQPPTAVAIPRAVADKLQTVLMQSST